MLDERVRVILRGRLDAMMCLVQTGFRLLAPGPVLRRSDMDRPPLIVGPHRAPHVTHQVLQFEQLLLPAQQRRLVERIDAVLLRHLLGVERPRRRRQFIERRQHVRCDTLDDIRLDERLHAIVGFGQRISRLPQFQRQRMPAQRGEHGFRFIVVERF